MSTLINKLGFDAKLFEDIGENLDLLQSKSSTRTLTVGKTVSFTGSINGNKIPAEATLREASIKRLTVIDQLSPNTGKRYFLVTGVFNPVKMDVTVTVDGEKITIDELLYRVVAEMRPNTNRADFAESLKSMGMDFSGSLPLFFQQFGANQAGFQHAIEAFKSAGAVDAIGDIETRGRKNSEIVAVYAHKDGVPVTSFELGSVNREMSQTKQGFVDIVDAVVSTFTRVYGLRLQAEMLAKKTDGLSQKQITEVNAKIDKFNQLARQWKSSWSGSQQRMVKNPAGIYEPADMYDPVNAPCGRFTMVVNGAEVPCDLWSNSARANNAPSSQVELTDEEAF